MKYTLITVFIFITIGIFSQNTQPVKEMIFQSDSLDLWNYDIIKIEKNEKTEAKNPVSKIVFFRNAAIQDSLYSSNGLRPAVIFYVYPISFNPKVKEMSRRVTLTSSCQPPDRGGLYYVTKNFALLNYTSCTLCSTSSDRQTDLCKANIDRIIKAVSEKDYKSFEQLCKDLPVKKGKYY